MADSLAAASNQIRKERIHTTMLIELLALLVFMSMAYAFLSRDELRKDPLQAKVERLERELAEMKTENRRLERENAVLKDTVRRLIAEHDGTLRANPKMVTLPESQFKELTGELANKDQMLEERQRDNARLRAQLAGGGSDLPNCTVTAGFLVSIELLGDGSYLVKPNWADGAAPAVARLPGVDGFATSRPLSRAQFEAHARQLRDWGRDQSVACGFRARVTNRHSSLDLYKSQNRVVERYFYTARY